MNQPLPAAQFQTRGAGVAWRETRDEIVILDLDSSFYFGLNPTGARLWKLLAKGATYQELVDQLVHDGAGGVSRATTDADQFLDALRAAGLVVQH